MSRRRQWRRLAMFTLRHLYSVHILAFGLCCWLGAPVQSLVRPALAAGLVPLDFSDTNRSALVQERLSNGMRVVLIPNPAATLTNLSIVYQLPTSPPSVRSVWLAQLLRVLLPGVGTSHLSAAARKQLLLTADTDIERERAVLDSGHLVLTVSVPPDALELAAFIEADRVGFAVESLNQATIDQAANNLARTERSSGELLDAWLDDALTASSAVLADEVRSRTAGVVAVAELSQFMVRYLNAGNATLVIEGPLEGKSALDAVWRTFGRLPAGSPLALTSKRVLHGSPARFAIDPAAAGWSQTRGKPAFLLSWRMPECAAVRPCAPGVIAEWLDTRLSTNSSAWCTRVWAEQSWSRSRFTVGCQPESGFHAVRWASHVQEQLQVLDAASTPPPELRQATDRYRVGLLSALSLPEHRAVRVARQIAQQQIPVLPLAANVTADEMRAALRSLLRAAPSEVWAWSAQSEPRPISSEANGPPAVGIRESFWYRPPRKDHSRPITFPSIEVRQLSANLTVRHLEQTGAQLARVTVQGMLRDRDWDPAIARVALEALLRAGLGESTLVERLWIDDAVRSSWEMTSNTLSVQLTGEPAGLETAIQAVHTALMRAVDSTGSLARAKDAALLRSEDAMPSTPLNQLRSRVGSPFTGRVDSQRLADFRARMNGVETAQVQRLWASYATHGEFAISVLGPQSSQEALRIASAVFPASWAYSTPHRRSLSAAPRIWILDQPQRGSDSSTSSDQVDLEVIWPRLNRGADLREALVVAGISRVAKALGNLNAARPHNPTTQFILDHRSLAECDVEVVAIAGIDAGRLPTVLRELDGYFARLIERVDFPRLSRLGAHDLQRRQLAWFATPSRTMTLFEEWSLSGSPIWYPFDNYQNLGLVPRDALLAWARGLTLSRATLIAKGAPSAIEPWLREVNRGEVVVVRR